MRLALLCIPFALSASMAMAGKVVSSIPEKLVCNPKGETTRVLKSPSPNDIHPDWQGDNFLGDSWGILTDRLLRDEFNIQYVHGDLISPRGGKVNAGVYGLLSEWNCFKSQ